MDHHQKTIQNEGDTPFFRDLEDDTSPPRKRVKHDSDFDSSEQKPDIDFYLPKEKPEREAEWRRMFNFRFYEPKSPEVFKDIFTKCEEEIGALKKAHDMAKHFFIKEIADLQKEQPGSITTKVLETILGKQKLAYGYIREAERMLPVVKEDVDKYIKYRDDILLKRNLLWEPYLESVKQLAKMPSVDKMIKFLWCGVGDFGVIENHSRLASMDMALFHGIFRENQVNFDTEEYNEDEEQFGLSNLAEVLKANEGSISNVRSLREAYERADADVKTQSLVYASDTYQHLRCLSLAIQSAISDLGIMRQQMKLLYDKNVKEKGYYSLFYYDWQRCPFMVDD